MSAATTHGWCTFSVEQSWVEQSRQRSIDCHDLVQRLSHPLLLEYLALGSVPRALLTSEASRLVCTCNWNYLLSTTMNARRTLAFTLALLFDASAVGAFTSLLTTFKTSRISITYLPATVKPAPKNKGYEPKWKKKETLADQNGGIKDFKQIGLKGNVPVIFKQGNETRATVALAGQPLRDVATQADQFIKYGCGKGECGTCECLVNGQWIRPCQTNVPGNLAPGEEYVVQVKEVKNKAVSSGKFYSFRSFIMGFYNNLLGMVGFVKYRRAAKKNWLERQEYEDLIRQKTMQKKIARERSVEEDKNNKLSP